VGVPLLLAIILGAGYAIVSWAGHAMNEPWGRLRDAAAAIQTDAGARGLYAANHGLTERFPSAEEFVTTSKAWRPKLLALPPQPPSVWTLVKSGGSMSVSESGAHTRFEMSGYRGMSVLMVLEAGRLADLWVE
jgi:hypothetical protein